MVLLELLKSWIMGSTTPGLYFSEHVAGVTNGGSKSTSFCKNLNLVLLGLRWCKMNVMVRSNYVGLAGIRWLADWWPGLLWVNNSYLFFNGAWWIYLRNWPICNFFYNLILRRTKYVMVLWPLCSSGISCNFHNANVMVLYHIWHSGVHKTC